MKDKRSDSLDPASPAANAATASVAQQPHDDLPLRARLKALELIVGQLVAEQLELSGDAVATADAALRALTGAVTELPLYDIPRDEQSRFRDQTKYAVFDVLQRAVSIASASAGAGAVLDAPQD
jgi:hypothetical protein